MAPGSQASGRHRKRTQTRSFGPQSRSRRHVSKEALPQDSVGRVLHFPDGRALALLGRELIQCLHYLRSDAVSVT